MGTGPGTFTGLRIGVSTARALAQAGGQELVAVSSLEALALPSAGKTAVVACGDARRGELWVAGWRDGSPLLGPARAVRPVELAGLVDGPWQAVGDGAVRYRVELEAAGAAVPPDGSPSHRIDGAALCALARLASPVDPGTLEPEYVREPDAVPTHLR